MWLFLPLRFGSSESLPVREGGTLDAALGLEASGTVSRGWNIA